jgi:hypothetical protein
MRIYRTTRSCTASRQGLWGRRSSPKRRARVGQIGNAVLGEETERPIQPCPIPPLPTETVTLAGPHQVVPNLLLDPVANVREAPARMADRKVPHPATQHRVDLGNHLADGPGPMPAENRLEGAQQRRPLLHPRGAKRHPSVSPTANPTEVKPQKSEALALREVHPPTLLLVHLDLERRQFLSKSPFHRRTEPVLARMPSPVGRGLELRNHYLSAPLGSLALRPGDSLTIPKVALSVGFIRFVSFTDATRATGLLTRTLVGLIPTEHVCLVWTHCLPRTRFFLRTLILWPSPHRVLADAIPTRCVAADPPNVTPCSVDPARRCSTASVRTRTLRWLDSFSLRNRWHCPQHLFTCLLVSAPAWPKRPIGAFCRSENSGENWRRCT